MEIPPGPRPIDEVLEETRGRLHRLEPAEAAARMAAGGLLVDTRPVAQREADGEVPGALLVERNHLEWRFDPASDAKLPEATGYDVEVIVMCNEGYSSSLAADSLRALGLHRASDDELTLLGPFEAHHVAFDLALQTADTLVLRVPADDR